MNEQNKWVAPEWLKPYMHRIIVTGKFTVEELMNDNKTSWEDDRAKHFQMISVRAQVKLLKELHEAGLL